MKINSLRSAGLLVLLCLVFSFRAQAAEITLPWQTNFDQALKQAKQEHKKIFLLFTGGNWCGACILAEKNLFQTPEFAEYTREHLVLVKVLFESETPMNSMRKPAAQLDQSKLTMGQKLFLKYPDYGAHCGVPTVVLLDENGTKICQLDTTINVDNGTVQNFLANVKAETPEFTPEEIKETQAAYKAQDDQAAGGPGAKSAALFEGLTQQELQKYVTAQQQAMNTNPDLLAEMKHLQALRGGQNPGAPDAAKKKAAYADDVKTFRANVRAAMLKVDPMVAPLFAKVDEARKEKQQASL